MTTLHITLDVVKLEKKDALYRILPTLLDEVATEFVNSSDADGKIRVDHVGRLNRQVHSPIVGSWWLE